MVDDDAGTLQVADLVVRVDAGLVLREEDGVDNLSDVVVQGTGTHQLAVGVYPVGDLCCQVAYGDAVLECSGSNLAHLSHQFVVGVRQFEERHVGGESECLLDDEHQRIGEEEEEAVDGKVDVDRVVQFRHVVALYQLQGIVDHRRP